MIVRALPNGSMVQLKGCGAEWNWVRSRTFSKAAIIPQTDRPPLTFLSPSANALDTVKRVRAEMERMKSVSARCHLRHSLRHHAFRRVSIHEVIATLRDAMILVLLVVYLFLQSWRATLIPALAVPVSLVGTFAGMAALGFRSTR